MSKLTGRLSAVMMSVLLLCGLVQPAAVKADEKDFDEFLKDKWVEMMEADYTTMHFSVKDYKSMNLEKPEVTLGSDLTYEAQAEEVEKAKKSLEELHAYDFNSLTETQQYDYRVYEQNLEDMIAVGSFPDYIEMFNPYTGVQSNLTTIFTEFVFYTREDIDDYLTLIADYPRYMNEMMEFTKQQAAKGYFMADRALDVELEQLAELTGKGEEAPFIVIFNGRVDAFEGLTDEERQAYKDRNREIVLNEVFPATDHIAEELETLRGSRSVGDKSLYYYPDGKEYYNALMHKKISDDASAQEVFDYLSKAVQDCYSYIMDATLSLQGDPQEIISTMHEPTEMLDYLQKHLEGFPKGPELTYTASYLDPSVANPSVMAYYMTTPIDDVTDNVIRVNGTSISDDDMNTLYYTLAHEGFPGHLYQFTWFYSQGKNNEIRHDLDTIGYTEGWAQYVEKIMLNRSPLNRAAQEYTFGNVFLGYTLQAAIDVAVNGLGYDADQLTKWAESIGLSGITDMNMIYETVADGAGQILPYGYGLAKFWELRERTQKALGDDFDMEDYHLQILTNGPRSFDIVEEDLVKYVESKGREMPKEFTFFECERTEDMMSIGGMMTFAQKHGKLIIAAVIVIFILILVLLFLLIRGIIRLFTGKKRRNRSKGEL